MIELVGTKDKPLLRLLVTLGMLAFMLGAGRMAEKSWWSPILLYMFMGGVAGYAVFDGDDQRAIAFVPVVAGVVTWIVTLSFLTEPMHRHAAARAAPPTDRRRTDPTQLLIRAGFVGIAAIGTAVTGDLLGRHRRHVEESRRLLNLPISDRTCRTRSRSGSTGSRSGRPPTRRSTRSTRCWSYPRSNRRTGSCASTARSTVSSC